MDTLDRISIWTIAVLIISSFALMGRHAGEARPVRNNHQAAKAAGGIADAELDARVKAAKAMIEGGNLGKAEMLTRELASKYPFDGEPRMLLGDIYFRRQAPVKAVLEYKEAVELNPDYLDRKTPLFQGKKLKTAVKEALEELGKMIAEAPGDESLRKTRKIIYYMQRRIAGSCG